ncbi:adenylate/guanylate cyclase domain-containing protein [Pseudodesulfovibrio sediminis]|uniref:Adenylate/guanylate cyclase domain-containing protein n=1 Tax=Pseudodesulfovibrio sediminis TaxID=2810563 RepID=A0ABM7P520_9BACT|nr:adenylate/guanylate cyclase domain-containing protein [Pseudodesulfovibrio sediminis]BCS87968.1 adenylate/guanylate cyclase domain-containing protein [Pseudodesulfovibrio sediminis]
MVFTILVSVIVTILVGYGYKSNTDAAVIAAHQLLSQVEDSVADKTKVLFDTAFRTVSTAVSFPNIERKATIHSHPLEHVFFNFLEQNKDVTSIYTGFGDGDFFLVSSLHGRGNMKKSLNIPSQAAWYTQVIGHRPDGQRYELRKFLDAGFVTVGSSTTLNVEYDPRNRPWFKSTDETNIATLSDVYVFSLSGEPGITVSRRFDGLIHGVVGVDLSLSNLSRFLKSQLVGKDSEIMIFGANGDVYAYPKLDRLVTSIGVDNGRPGQWNKVGALGSKVLSALMRQFMKDSDKSLQNKSLMVDGVSHLVAVTPLPKSYGKELFIGMAIPESSFTGPIADVGKRTILVSLGMLFLFFPVIYIVSKRISRPLNELTKSLEEIKAFKLDTPIKVRSHIFEIRELGKASETMRETLNVFGRYIPKPLVESMIVNKIVPTLGGDRRMMTFLFSDIKDFTTISEQLTPEQVTGGITQYLKDMGETILDNGGTIDKYIGDAIMVFWNAPVADDEHAFHACLTALECRDVLTAFNQKRRENGKPEFLTRMGVHTGEAVVGNIGSSDRMAYTAMGAAVNLASRLEGLNKYMGTDILVSESTMRAAGEGFLFRFAGKVVPKGSSVEMGVYELLGTRHGATGVFAPFAVDVESMNKVREWEGAMDLFLARNFVGAVDAFSALLDLYGADSLVDKYHTLAQSYAVTPPDTAWCGELSFDVK